MSSSAFVLPEVRVNPSNLPPLLRSDVTSRRFLPYIRARALISSSGPRPTPGDDPWDLPLEMEYQKVHPGVWEILEADDAIDWAAYDALRECREQESLSAEERRRGLMLLGERIKTRMYRILGMHLARKGILESLLSQNPGQTLRNILSTLPAGVMIYSLKDPVASLWPLPPEIPLPAANLTLVTFLNADHHRLFTPSPLTTCLLTAEPTATLTEEEASITTSTSSSPLPIPQRILAAGRRLQEKKRRRKGYVAVEDS